MKISSVQEIKSELENISHKDLKLLCLKLARFKKENKELLTYILFESHDPATYIQQIKNEIDDGFLELPKANHYLTKKSLRKILRSLNKYIRHIGKDESEIEILIHFATVLKNSRIQYKRATALKSLYEGQIRKIKKAISSVHEDLQFDYLKQIESLED